MQQRENEFKKHSLIDQKKEIVLLKKQLKKVIKENNEREESRKFITKYLKEIIDDKEILSKENLKLKNTIMFYMESIKYLIESSKFYRKQLQEKESSFNELLIDYNLLSDTIQSRSDKAGRNISAKYLKIVKS
jgi:hypothetical protein